MNFVGETMMFGKKVTSANTKRLLEELIGQEEQNMKCIVMIIAFLICLQ
jgi:hypothetical protein